jgi:chorismate dehydratase
MNKYKVSAVSFYNTLPLVYGLKNSPLINEIELSVDNPARCAEKLIEGSADIGLVPVATIPFIKNANVFSQYCIGATGKVRTVILASDVPLHEIKKIILDSHSRSSNELAKIMAKEFWKINVGFQNGYEGFENIEIKGNTAAVVIGDKAFGIEKKHSYIIDMAEEWKKFTGLPLVFACWAANKPLEEEFIRKFDDSMKFGLGHIHEASLTANLNGFLDYESIEYYLRNNISFIFDEKKKEAMKLFLEMLSRI